MNEKLGVDFRYFLTYRNVKTEIFTPDGWDSDTIVSYKRDTFYFGVIRSFALPLSFVENGASILRNAFFNDGVQAGVRFEAEQLNRSTLQYELFFVGDVDFSKKVDSGNRFTVTLMQSGPTERMKAYESTKYEFELIGDDVLNMILPGVAFTELGNFIINPSQQSNFTFMPGMNYIQGLNSGVLSPNSPLERNGIDLTPGNSYWFLKVNKTQELKFTGKIKGTAFTRPVQGSSTFHFEIRNQINGLVEHIGQVTSPATLGSTKFDINISFTGTFTEDTYLFMTVRGTGDDDNYCKFDADCFIDVNLSSVSDPSDCKAIKGIDLFKRIIKRIDSAAQADSYLLNGAWKNLLFTSGNAIREIPSARIKISLKDFFKTFNSIDDSGMGLENGIVRLENKPFFARMALSVDVGEIGDQSCELVYPEQFAASGANLGYKDGNTEDKNGLEEYNSGQEWEWPITRLQNTFDWVSVARADQFGIEKIRVDFNVKREKGTNDTPSDNDVFIVDCYQDGLNYRPILGSTYDLVTGLLSGSTAYNLGITPKKNLLRHGAYLRSIMDRMDIYYINFASAEKNQELRTVKNGVSVKENENILIGNLPAPYFLPHIANIKCKLPIGAVRLFDNVPFGFVRFNWRGNILSGFILECNVDIAKNSEQEFKLLLTTDNNLLNLVNL